MNAPANQRSFLVTLVLVTPLLFFGFRYLGDQRTISPLAVADEVRELSEKSLLTSYEAKQRSVFWVSTISRDTRAQDVAGLGVDLLARPELFSQAYPGYEALRQDHALWKSYFSSDFNADIYLPSLNRQRLLLGTSVSWTGCLKIYERLGADVIVLGSSETYRQLIPDELAHAPTLKSDSKILTCTLNDTLLDNVAWTAGRLATLREKGGFAKAAWAIWGFSPVQANPGSSIDESLRAYLYSSVTKESFRSRFDLPEWFPTLSWSGLLPVSFELFKTDAALRALAKAPGRNYVTVPGVVVPDAIRSDPSAILDTLERKGAFMQVPSDFTLESCELAAVATDVRETVDELLKVAERVLVYIPPTTDLVKKDLPDCFMPALTRMLGALSSERVRVLTADWKTYGLDYSDYTYPMLNPALAYVELNHVNLKGARKVTAFISGKALGSGLLDP